MAKWSYKGKTRIVQIRPTSDGMVFQQLDKTNQQLLQMQKNQSGVAPTAQMGDAAKGGVSPGMSGSGKPMQRLEQSMSPNGTQPGSAGGNSTGIMKQ